MHEPCIYNMNEIEALEVKLVLNEKQIPQFVAKNRK